MSTHYSLHVIRAQDVLYKSFFHGKPSLYVVVRFGSTVRRTQPVKNNLSPTWDQSLAFSSSDPSEVFKIQLKHRSKGPRDKDIGIAEIGLHELIALCDNGEAQINVHEKRSQTLSGKVFLRLKSIDETEAISQDLEGTRKATQGVREDAADSTAVAIADGVMQLSEAGDLYDSLEKLCETLDVFVKFIDDVSKIHPYFSAAWQVATSVYKAVSKQFECDQKVVELVRSMEKAFTFARSTQDLKGKTRILESSIVELFKQIKACCEFIQGYVGHSFGGRMLDTGASKKIDEFMQVLARCERDIDSGLLHHNTVIEARTAGSVDTLYLQQRLKPDELISASRATCLEGTRVAIRREIIDWVNSKSEPNILLLHGIAGAGKSTIALTISDYFLDVRQRGALLVFEQGKSEAHSVIRTLSFKLASFDPSIRSRIVDQIRTDEDIASASSKMQFEKLIAKPLEEAGKNAPVIVILDGLDECGTPESRRELLQLFREELPKLPKSFRFFITSRTVSDILSAFSDSDLEDCARVIQLDVHTVDSHNDVQKYIRSELQHIVLQRDVPPDWSWDDNMSLLDRSANGLFVWASAAVKLVEKSHNPFQRLQRLLSDSRLLNNHGLDQLYDTVFRSSGISWDDDESKTDVTNILGLVLLAKVTLSISDIDSILALPSYNSSRHVLSSLQSVLDYSTERPVSFFHTSLKDYLLSPNRSCDPWFIDIPSMHTRIATACFRFMKDMLCFNICNIESSLTTNEEIPELQNRIREKIPCQLSYACQFWGHHLHQAPYSSELLGYLSDFLHERFLYWLEVISLLKVVHCAESVIQDALVWLVTNILQCILQWLQCGYSGDIIFLGTAERFIHIFQEPISKSTAHIYVSAVPFMVFLNWPSHAFQSQYLKHMSSTVQFVQCGLEMSLLEYAVKKTKQREEDGIPMRTPSASISSSNKFIALGFSNQKIEILDVRSFEPVLVIPSTDHELFAFSSDDSRVASSYYSDLIKVWDITNGKQISPDICHSGPITFLALSSNGERLVSGNPTGSIIIWDVNSGETVGHHNQGCSDIRSVIAFSPDDMRIVLGSFNGLIKIWDAQCTNITPKTLHGGCGAISSLCFSPDGTRMAVGHEYGAVVIRDANSGKLVITLQENQRKDLCNIVAFSNDGSLVLSGDKDGNILVWDASNGSILSGPHQVHADRIIAAAFLPNMAQIVSVSHDETARISDILTNDPLSSQENLGNTLSSWAARTKYDLFSNCNDSKGWIRGDHGELLLWLPPFIQRILWHPRNTTVHTEKPLVKVDFSNFAHGEHWAECFNPSP